MKLRLSLLSLLSLIGAGISLYQTHHFYELREGLAGFKSFCTFGAFDCEAIELSAWAELAFGIPLSTFAAGWLFSIFVFSLLARFPESLGISIKALLPMSIVGVLFSGFYFFVMVFKIEAYCLLCLAVDAINLALLGISVSLHGGARSLKCPSLDVFKKIASVSAPTIAGSLLVGFLLKPAGIKQVHIDEIVDSVLSTPPVGFDAGVATLAEGPEDAPVVIVKFSDFECPACKRGAVSIYPALKQFSGKVRYVVKNFPLDPTCNRLVPQSVHVKACAAAKAALCAAPLIGPMEAYHTLFEKQDLFKDLDPAGLLISGEDPNRRLLLKCVEGSEMLKQIQDDIDLGEKLELKSTPTFFVNGHRVEGSIPTRAWTAIIQKLLTHADR